MSYFVYYLIFSLVQKCVVHTTFDIFESWTHSTSLTPPPSRVISVSLQESERSCICVSGILILSMFLRFCDWILELLPQCVCFLFVLLFIIYDDGKVQWPSHVNITIWFDKTTAMKHKIIIKCMIKQRSDRTEYPKDKKKAVLISKLIRKSAKTGNELRYCGRTSSSSPHVTPVVLLLLETRW